MRIALISDIHANLPALRAVIDDVTAIGCDAVWCAGDLVGCPSILREHSVRTASESLTGS